MGENNGTNPADAQSEIRVQRLESPFCPLMRTASAVAAATPDAVYCLSITFSSVI